MEKFVDFFQKFYESQYSRLMQKLIAEKTPCGVCFPLTPMSFHSAIANQFRRAGLNLTTIVYTGEDDFETPNDFKVLSLNPPPPVTHSQNIFSFSKIFKLIW